MKVRDLIRELSKYDEDMEVTTFDHKEEYANYSSYLHIELQNSKEFVIEEGHNSSKIFWCMQKEDEEQFPLGFNPDCKDFISIS